MKLNKEQRMRSKDYIDFTNPNIQRTSLTFANQGIIRRLNNDPRFRAGHQFNLPNCHVVRNIKYPRSFLLIFLLIGNALLFGQDQKDEGELTLQECISIALEQNFGIRTSQNDVLLKKSGLKSAYGSFLPTLNYNGSWNRTNSISTSDGGVVYVQGVPVPVSAYTKETTSNRFNTSLNSSLNLFNGWTDVNTLNRSQATLNASQNNLQRMKQQVVLQVYSLYFNIMRTFQLLKVSQNTVEFSRQQFEKIQESANLGAVSITNVYQQQAQLAQDELALTQAQNNYDLAILNLLSYLSAPANARVQITSADVSTEIDSMDHINLRQSLQNPEQLVADALQKRPDYHSARENVNSANFSLKSLKGGFLPALSSSIGYNLNSQQFNKLPDNRNLSWGLTVSYPLFSQLRTSTAVEQASINLDNALEQLKEIKRGIQVDINQAILGLDAAYKSFLSAQRSAAYQMTNLRLIQERYNLGANTLLDLLFATNNYFNAEMTRINASYQYLYSKKQLEFALGALSF